MGASSEQYGVLYGPEISVSSGPSHLAKLAFYLSSQLVPSKQVKLFAEHLLALEPEQAAKKLIEYSPLHLQAVSYIGEMGEKKETGEKARLVIHHAAEMSSAPRMYALCLLNLGPKEAAEIFLTGKVKYHNHAQIMRLLLSLGEEEEHKDRVRIVEEEMMNRLLEKNPTEAAEILHRYECPTRLRYITYLGQLKENKPSLTEKVDAIVDALLIKDGLPVPPPSAPSINSVKSPSDSTERKLLSNPDHSAPETLQKTQFEDNGLEEDKKKSPDAKEIIGSGADLAATSTFIPKSLSLFASPSPITQTVVVQPNHLSLEMKFFIGFVSIAMVGGAGYGLYKGLEAAGKIDATRAFFSDNYAAMLGGLGVAIGVIGLGLLIYCSACRSSHGDHAVTDPVHYSSPTS